MKTLFYLLIPILFFISCGSDDDPTGDILIRVENNSTVDFEDLVVGSTNYSDVNSGEYSQYRPFEIAYRYNYIELKSEGETFILQPIDFVGETPLTPGQYTYQLNILEAGGSQYLDLTFLVD